MLQTRRPGAGPPQHAAIQEAYCKAWRCFKVPLHTEQEKKDMALSQPWPPRSRACALINKMLRYGVSFAPVRGRLLCSTGRDWFCFVGTGRNQCVPRHSKSKHPWSVNE